MTAAHPPADGQQRREPQAPSGQARPVGAAAGQSRLPEVWASDLRIKLGWMTDPADPSLRKIERLLAAFNPAPGKHDLELLLDPTTGTVSGDARGAVDSLIRVSGSDERCPREMDFVLSKR